MEFTPSFDARLQSLPEPCSISGVLLHPPSSSEAAKITLVIKQRIFFGHSAATANNRVRKRFTACPGTLQSVYGFDAATVQNRNTGAPPAHPLPSPSTNVLRLKTFTYSPILQSFGDCTCRLLWVQKKIGGKRMPLAATG